MILAFEEKASAQQKVQQLANQEHNCGGGDRPCNPKHVLLPRLGAPAATHERKDQYILKTADCMECQIHIRLSWLTYPRRSLVGRSQAGLTGNRYGQPTSPDPAAAQNRDSAYQVGWKLINQKHWLPMHQQLCAHTAREHRSMMDSCIGISLCSSSAPSSEAFGAAFNTVTDHVSDSDHTYLSSAGPWRTEAATKLAVFDVLQTLFAGLIIARTFEVCQPQPEKTNHSNVLFTLR